MAEKATKSTKAAKKPLAKSVAKEVSLEEQLAAKQADLMTARISHKAGELVNPRVLKTTRREIARLKTAARKAELQERKK
jgi:ribosomal protein L29